MFLMLLLVLQPELDQGLDRCARGKQPADAPVHVGAIGAHPDTGDREDAGRDHRRVAARAKRRDMRLHPGGILDFQMRHAVLPDLLNMLSVTRLVKPGCVSD